MGAKDGGAGGRESPGLERGSRAVRGRGGGSEIGKRRGLGGGVQAKRRPCKGERSETSYEYSVGVS